jgi:hypothetical protein
VNDLPAKYAALVAKRPDLDIPGLEHIEDELWTYDVVSVEVEVSEAPEDAWKQEGPQWADGAAAIPTRVAAAMVECHLLRSLPSGCRTLVVSGRWQVRDTVHATNTDWFDTPLEALIAFYMEDRKP